MDKRRVLTMRTGRETGRVRRPKKNQKRYGKRIKRSARECDMLLSRANAVACDGANDSGAIGANSGLEYETVSGSPGTRIVLTATQGLRSGLSGSPVELEQCEGPRQLVASVGGG